jgi:hypothetical protein
MELLLINHPLDCPVCDKGGECPLQNQAMSATVVASSRFEDIKRTYPKPINISSRCCSTASAACCAPAAPASPTRSPVTRSSPSSSAARCSRSASTKSSRSSPTSPATPSRSARSGRSPARPTASARAPSTSSRRRACASTAPVAARSAPTTVAARAAPHGPERPRGQRGVELRQGPLGLHSTPTSGIASSSRWSARTASCGSGLLARGLRVAAAGLGAKVPPVCSPVAGVTPRTPTPTASSPASGARHQRRRLPGPPALGRGGRLPGRARRAHRPRQRVRSPTPTSRRRQRRRPRRVRARGREPDRLPAPAQGLPQEQDGRVCRGAVATRGLAKVGGPASSPPPGTEAEVLGPWHRRRLAAQVRRSEAAQGPARAASSSSGSGWPPCPVPSRRRGQAGCETPAPGWPGCRVAPGSAARSRPAPCRPCCPVAARSPTPPPAPRSPRPGASRRCPRTDGRDAAGIVAGLRAPASSMPSSSAVSTRSTWVSGTPTPCSVAPSWSPWRSAAVRGHGIRRCDPAGRPGRREGRHLRRLGGPGPRSFEAALTTTRSATTARWTCWPTRWATSSAPAPSAEVAAEMAVLARCRHGPSRRRPRTSPPSRAASGRPMVTWCWRPGGTCSTGLHAGRGALPRGHRAQATARVSATTAQALGLADGDEVRVDLATGACVVTAPVTSPRWPTTSSGCRPTRQEVICGSHSRRGRRPRHVTKDGDA